MRIKSVMVLAGAALAAAGFSVSFPSAPARAADKVDFVKDVQPIFAQYCVKCHGADPKGKKPKGKYDMTTKEAALKGGENKNCLIPGKPEDSLLYKTLLGPVGSGDDEIERMPSKKDKLTDEQIKIIHDWIQQGAEWPDGVKVALKE
jgi:mono/diheme cytochrome c family protein